MLTKFSRASRFAAQNRNGVKRLLLRCCGLLGGYSLGGLFTLSVPLGQPVLAAERVTLTYGFLEISASIESLRNYAELGEIDPALAPYLDFLDEAQRSQFREALQIRHDTSPVHISQFLYSSIGENILRYLGGIIQTQGRRDGAKGLRGALVLAAAEPEGLSMLGVLEHFPTDTVRIDSQRAFRTLNSFTGLLDNTEQALAAIARQSAPREALASPTPELAELAQAGPYRTTVQTLMVVDDDRDRILPTDLYLPEAAVGAANRPAPLVVISHGLSGDRKGFVVLAEHLTSHGFAVAAIDHPGSDTRQLQSVLGGRAQEIAEPTEFSDRPGDVSYLLDELTRLNAADAALANRFDLAQISIMGHSFGGYTALALAGAQLDFDTLQANCQSEDFIYRAANPSMLLQCTALLAPEQFERDLRDPRIQAVIALNPVTSSLFGRDGIAQVETPSLWVAGSDDSVAPALLEQIRPYTWLRGSGPIPLTTEPSMTELPTTAPPPADERGAGRIPNRHYLALIQGGTHLYEPPRLNDVEVTLGRDLVNADIPLAYSYLKALSLVFLQSTVLADPRYQQGLGEAAIIRGGQHPLPLFVTDSLTEAMLQPLPVDPVVPEVSPVSSPPASSAISPPRPQSAILTRTPTRFLHNFDLWP